MPKITFIGAGSTIFAKNLMGDILSFPELAGSTICLHDIDETRLRESELVAGHIIETLQVKPAIEATTDRRAALDGADYAIGLRTGPSAGLVPLPGQGPLLTTRPLAGSPPSPGDWALTLGDVELF